MTRLSQITTNKVLTVPIVGGGVPAVSQADKEVLLAFSSPKICDMKTPEIGLELNIAISRAYYHVGHSIPNFEELLALQTYLADFLKSEFTYQNLHIDEITIALKRGSDGKYGEFFGINPATITGWIKSHVESESRKAAKLMRQEILNSQSKPVEPSDEEKKEDFIQRLEMLYIYHTTKQKEILQTEATYYFEKLWEAKVIRFTQEQKDELKRKAFEHLTTAKNPTLSKTKDQYDKLKTVYNAFLSAGVEGNEVKRYAMYLGLLMWFDDLKAFDREIRDEVI